MSRSRASSVSLAIAVCLVALLLYVNDAAAVDPVDLDVLPGLTGLRVRTPEWCTDMFTRCTSGCENTAVRPQQATRAECHKVCITNNEMCARRGQRAARVGHWKSALQQQKP